MLIWTAESEVASTWMKPLMFRTSRVLPPPAAKDSVRVTVVSSRMSYRDERCACAGPISATPITMVAKVSFDMPFGWPHPRNWLEPGYSFRMAKAKKRAPRRKKAAAGSIGLTVAETRTVDAGSVRDLAASVEDDGGAVLGTYRDPFGGTPVLIVSLPI